MASTPTPPAGYHWRPVRLEDATALGGLFAAIDAVEELEEVLGPEGIQHEMRIPGLDRRRDTRLALTPEGEVAGFAWVWTQVTTRAARAIVWIEAHPAHLHLEPSLLAWAEATARPLLEAAPRGTRRYLRQHVEEHRRRRRRVAEEAGYHHARTFVEMWRSLTRDVPAAGLLPAGTELRAWSPGLAESARLASNEAFALHWDSLPLGPADWESRVCGDPHLRPDLSRLAVREGRVVGLCLTVVDDEQNAREGVAEMWLARIGTRPAFQRQGLATALIADVLRAGAGARLDRAGLAVDHDSASRATALYERLGFAATRRTLAYVKDLP